MDIKELQEHIIREITALREDLHDLKRCQLQYFALAITSTGLILGLADIFSDNYKGLAILAPLFVILPSWAIFFDKATTIARIVGYQRCLEKQLQEEKQIYLYLGYERALAKFRAHEEEAWQAIPPDIRSRFKIPSLPDLLLLKTRHRFWMINWYTFAFLAVVCCTAGGYILINHPYTSFYIPSAVLYIPLVIAVVLTVISIVYTFYLIHSLTHGGLSYNACFLKWKYILDINRKIDVDE